MVFKSKVEKIISIKHLLHMRTCARHMGFSRKQVWILFFFTHISYILAKGDRLPGVTSL